MNHLLEIKSSNSLLKCIAFVLKDFKVKCRKDINFINETKGITEGLLTEYRSIRCLNYVKFFGNTDYDFPQELNGIN